MAEENYQFDDFFANLNDEYKDFVTTIHEMVQENGFDKIAIGSSKVNLFTVKYTNKKTRRGIVNLTLRRKSFAVTVLAANNDKYPELLNKMPEQMANQIEKVHTCKNISEPGQCMDKCVGYEFHVRDRHFQKCKFGCFKFTVDAENMPYLLELIKTELEMRKFAAK